MDKDVDFVEPALGIEDMVRGIHCRIDNMYHELEFQTFKLQTLTEIVKYVILAVGILIIFVYAAQILRK